MISSQDRTGWIGGSDAIRLYADFESKTFINWWEERKTGNRGFSLDNEHIDAGNILEGPILEYLGIPEKYWSVKQSLEGTMAGVNTDALYKGCVEEIKTMMLSTLIDKYVIAGNKISKVYRAQLLHAMICTGTSKARIHIMGLTEAEKRWPFSAIPLIPERLYTFEFTLDDFNEENFNPEDHLSRIKYLSQCFERGVRPTNHQLNIFRNVKNNTIAAPDNSGIVGTKASIDTLFDL